MSEGNKKEVNKMIETIIQKIKNNETLYTYAGRKRMTASIFIARESTTITLDEVVAVIESAMAISDGTVASTLVKINTLAREAGPSNQAHSIAHSLFARVVEELKVK